MASSSAAPQGAQEGQSRLASDDDNESYEHSFVSADEENPGDATGAIGAGALPEVFNASRTQRLSMAMERCCRAFHFPVPKLPQRSRDDASKLDSAVLWLQGNTQYLMQSAIGGWSAAFTRVMHEAVAIRIEPVAVALKEGGRPVQGRCMACGHPEERCGYRLDILGRKRNPGEQSLDQWTRSLDGLKFAWERHYAMEHLRRLASAEKLAHWDAPPTDNFFFADAGSYMLGCDCLRKVQRYFAARTLVRDVAIAASVALDEEDPLGAAWNAKASALAERLHELELAVADAKRPVPLVTPTYADLWAKLDLHRSKIASTGPDALVRALRLRSASFLGVSLDELAGDDDGERQCDEELPLQQGGGGEMNDEQDDESQSGGDGVGRRPDGSRRSARFVVREPEDEGGDEEGEAAAAAYVGGARGKYGAPRVLTRAQRRAREAAPAASDVAPPSPQRRRVEAAPASAPAPESAAAPAPAPAAAPAAASAAAPAAASASAPLTAASLARHTRMHDQALPSRREAIAALHEVAATLLRGGFVNEAALVTRGAFVAHELLDRIRQLEHSRER